MKNLLIIFFFLFSFVFSAMAQSISLKIDSVNLEGIGIGDKISIPVYCENLEGEIAAYQMYIKYDHDVLTFQSVSEINPEVKSHFKDNNTETFWASVWLSPERETFVVSPGAKLFELEYIYNGGETILEFGEEDIVQNGRKVMGKTSFITLDHKSFLFLGKNGCVCKF